MGKKEIWIINHYAVSPEISAATRHFDLSSELTKHGFNIKIFASDFRIALGKRTKLKPGEKFKIEKIQGVDFVWIWASSYFKNNIKRILNMLFFSFNVFRVGRKLEEKPEIIIGSSPHLFSAFFAFFLAKIKKANFFLEIRDLWPLFLVELSGISKFHPLNILFRMIEKFLYKFSHRIIILAPGNRDYLLKNGVKEEKIIFIPNGVHLENFKPKLPREEGRKKFDFKKFTAVYAGAHGPANALHTIVGAAEVLKFNKEIEFVLVGGGVLKGNLKELAKEKGLDNIRFLDPIPREDIPDLLQASDAGIITLKDIPSFYFGVSPNKFFDYMASGLPIISAVGGEISNIVEKFQLGLSVPPEKATMLAEAVKAIAETDIQKREQFGKNGIELVRKSYSRQKLGEKLARICQEISEGKK